MSSSAGYVKEQYNTNKALLHAVSSMVVGMNVQDFLKVAVQKIPAAHKEFSELYGEELLAMKIGRGMMAMYKAAPRKVKATIIEGVVTQHGLTLKDLQEGLGVTRWQWNNAQLALQEFASGKKEKASRDVAMKVDEATVEKFVDFCLRPDNIQDIAFGSRGVKLDDGTSFICPHWIHKNHRAKMAHAFKQEFSASVDKMPSRTWMYKVMDWVATKDMVTLAGLKLRFLLQQ